MSSKTYNSIRCYGKEKKPRGPLRETRKDRRRKVAMVRRDRRKGRCVFCHQHPRPPEWHRYGCVITEIARGWRSLFRWLCGDAS